MQQTAKVALICSVDGSLLGQLTRITSFSLGSSGFLKQVGPRTAFVNP